MTLEIARWPIEDVVHIDILLSHQRELALRGGNVVSRDAWREIDRLLDLRNAVALKTGEVLIRDLLGGSDV